MVKKTMINVYPIRYKERMLEFLLIKRATLSYNWQCVTGSVGDSMGALDHPKGESPFECAKRELFEETGYSPTLILPLNIPPELFKETEDDEGEKSPPQLQEALKEVVFFNYIARIDQPQDPVLNPAEHTDWKWCSVETAYQLIKWAVEKKLLVFVYHYLLKNPLLRPPDSSP
jgi:8-oxo-dGTP pyrophosphatase MutT (NUDIX family)